MPRTMPWHSVNSDVYHNDTSCNAGKNVKPENRRSGTGGKHLCKQCERLSKKSVAPRWETR
jgi:hypothetical protein